jgi:hypothetical protein
LELALFRQPDSLLGSAFLLDVVSFAITYLLWKSSTQGSIATFSAGAASARVDGL